MSCIFCIPLKKNYDKKTIILKKNIDENEVLEIIEDKKTSLFKSLLSRPKKSDVHVHSLKLNYECILVISGKYVANYFRKATHSISVDSNVSEIIFGDGVFPVRSKSNFKKTITGKRGKNKVDIKLEEHVFVENEDSKAVRNPLHQFLRLCEGPAHMEWVAKGNERAKMYVTPTFIVTIVSKFVSIPPSQR